MKPPSAVAPEMSSVSIKTAMLRIVYQLDGSAGSQPVGEIYRTADGILHGMLNYGPQGGTTPFEVSTDGQNWQLGAPYTGDGDGRMHERLCFERSR